MPCKQWKTVIALQVGYWREAIPDSAIPWWKRVRESRIQAGFSREVWVMLPVRRGAGNNRCATCVFMQGMNAAVLLLRSGEVRYGGKVP